MTHLNPRFARATAGFTLIELMIALVAGLIVLGAVLAFTVSSVKANSDYIKSTRLTQELRNTSDYITSELKRAGYDEAAMDYVANPLATAVSKFAPIKVVTTAGANCVIYAYDRPAGTPGGIDLGNGEIRAIRRATTTLDSQTIGVIEVFESFGTKQPACGDAGPDYSNYPTTCNTTTGWCPLSDPRVVDIQTFTLGVAASAADSNGIQNIAAVSGFNPMQLREFLVNVAGGLRSDTAITRSVRSNIKVRADCLRANISACANAPAP